MNDKGIKVIRVPYNRVGRIKEIIEEGEVPTRIAVFDLEGVLLGHKSDSCWSLSTEDTEWKVHPLKDTLPTGHIADNLLHGFEFTFSKSVSQGWFPRFEEGVVISVQDVSPNTPVGELLSYRVVKVNGKYEIKDPKYN